MIVCVCIRSWAWSQIYICEPGECVPAACCRVVWLPRRRLATLPVNAGSYSSPIIVCTVVVCTHHGYNMVNCNYDILLLLLLSIWHIIIIINHDILLLLLSIMTYYYYYYQPWNIIIIIIISYIIISYHTYNNKITVFFIRIHK